MTRVLQVHPTHPQPRIVAQVVSELERGGVIAYPTDSSYALGCLLTGSASDELRRIRNLRKGHLLTLICAGLSDMAVYARLDNAAFRRVKPCVPGPYTFILRATGETPRRVQHAKRRTVGVRVPNHPFVQALLAEVGVPLVSTTLKLPGDTLPRTDASEIAQALRGRLAAVIDAGDVGTESTTVVDLTGDNPEVIRAGVGPVELFE
ncbi:MAG: threonylcarbamoyl-AMP synthase [Chromatiales bacterium]|jgi:tRNA threonylcarbamoyl adenosine modification protein (Sua5/YciO/YrdC/YwlC family)|nr:threonylcarbamoyl-AMP synthase [Chromatiales bacterium]